MLKIRDDVDLKELEKFGFGKERRCSDNTYYYQYANLVVISEDRGILLLDRKNGDDPYSKSLTKLSDMIKLGLVEKIEE